MKKLLPILFLSTLLFTCNKDEDPCEGITCKNGGECKNGTCDCPENYEGPDCSNQKTPSKIVITKVEITKFPSTEDDGGGWDFGDGPDLIFLILKGSTPVYAPNTYFPDAVSGSGFFWKDLNIEITEVQTQHTIELYDYDELDEDDRMGGISFTPYSNTNGFPTVIELKPSGSKINFNLTVTYDF